MNDGGHILVVDDRPTNRLKLTLGLKQQGHTSREAEDGRQALEMLRAERFDLVLLDILMPGTDGYEVLRVMKQDPVLQHLPVIVISAQDELESIVRGIELGADDYLPKPFEPVLLKARIGACLEKKRLREREQERIERDLALAREIQMGALPTQMPVLAGYELSAWSGPAEKTGGDIYDLIPLDERRVALLLADATGHGIAPALSVTQMQSMFRMGLLLGSDPGHVLSTINRQLQQNLPANRFVTAFGGILDGGLHQICFQSWGQDPLLHYHAASDRAQWFEASTLPLGILAEVPTVPPVCCEFAPGDVFAALSDGFFEYQNRAGEPFGEERVAAWARAVRGSRGPEETLASLRQRVEDFAGGAPQEDDMTIVVIRRVV